MIYLAFAVLITVGSKYPVMHVDQVSCCLPVLRWFGSAKLVFYCHFPDQLLAARKSTLKRLYRAPLDWFEEWTTGMAHTILVNSKFTGKTFASTFTSLPVVPEVRKAMGEREREGGGGGFAVPMCDERLRERGASLEVLEHTVAATMTANCDHYRCLSGVHTSYQQPLSPHGTHHFPHKHPKYHRYSTRRSIS
jgi:hypothetical protein